MQSAQKSGAAADAEHDVRQPSGRPPKAPAPGPSAAPAVDRRGWKPNRRDSRHDVRSPLAIAPTKCDSTDDLCLLQLLLTTVIGAVSPVDSRQ